MSEKSPAVLPKSTDLVVPQTDLERTNGTLMHLASFTHLIFPFGGIIVPLIYWVIQREKSPYLDAHGKEVLNFNISFTIYGVVAALSIFALVGFLLAPAVGLAFVVLAIIGCLKASEGRLYRYPFTIRFLK